MRPRILLPACFTALCLAEIPSRAKTEDLFKVHETCKNRNIEPVLDQTSLLLDKCIERVELLRSASANDPLSTDKRENRNLMLNAYHALGVTHPYQQDFQGFYTSVDDTTRLQNAAAHLEELQTYMSGKRDLDVQRNLGVKRDSNVKETRDFLTCSEDPYKEITLAVQARPLAPTVLTLLGEGLTKKAEEKLWLAFDDTTSGDQYNMHWDRAPCSIEGEYARVPQGRGKEWPGRLILCNLLFEQIAQRTIHNDLELSGGLLRDEAPPGKIAFLGHHTSVPSIILHELRHIANRDPKYWYFDNRFEILSRPDLGPQSPYGPRWISALTLRPEQFKFMPDEPILPGQKIGDTILIPETIALFCQASYILDTTWLWSPYDYGEGSIDHNHAADPKEEYARMSLDVDTAFKVDFGWPVAADNTDRIPED